ncbi:hypothetical protein [Flammeovirga sp. SJP92]|uniref:hypothetical protein n=1 Tax=Flammeovirga sp. SJP92 TaxID=1775430 RepID=UPI000789AA2D|nr:hypothetical protein [Flammeovirga sp. SJP92]KXX67746.1 hypothetical protein AVL50_25090 [Flammeovirga sp. SJP92]
MNKLTLQSEKEYKNFGLAFGLGFIIVQIFPLIYGLINGGNANTWTTIGLIFTSLFSSPAILFLGIGFLKGYKEKAIFWLGIMGLWMNVMLNLYIQQGGEVVYLESILHTLSRKLVALIISLLIIRHFINTKNLLQLFLGFGIYVIMSTASSFIQFSDNLSTDEIVSQALWGALFYVFGLAFGYTLFSVFSGKNDHEGKQADVITPGFQNAQLVFYFMIFCLYFADIWMGQANLRTNVNVLFQLLFASIGIIYFTKNIITIGMALTLLSLIGRIIAFSKDMSVANTLGVAITLLFLVLFEMSRRQFGNKSKK